MSAPRGWGRTGIVTSLSIVLGVAATAAWPVGPRIDRSSATAAPQPAQLGLDPSPSPTDPSPSPTDPSPSPTQESAGPNIVVILTDDQRADELREMDTVRTELVDRGLLFERAFNTNPLCCPARASLLTGLYSHHTGVWTNGDEGGELGGYPAFLSNGNESRTIAAVLDDAGYHTGLVGKYLNNAVDTPVPAGWDSWVAFNEVNGRYFDYELVVDTDTADAVAPTMEAHAGEAGDYSTDVLAQRAIAFVEVAPADAPLFLLLATYAPHGVSTPALRHEGIFADLPVALGDAYNEANVADKPGYIRELPRFPSTSARRFKRISRMRLESLEAVDEAVAKLLAALDASGRLHDTVIVFTSDNGQSLGEHRWTYKLAPYEETIRVPMVVRWDAGIAPAQRTSALALNIDVAPTLADLAGTHMSQVVDGRSLIPTFDDPSEQLRNEFLIEHVEFRFEKPDAPSYFAIRHRSERIYVRYATGEEEFYNLRTDPAQLRNAIGTGGNVLTQLRQRASETCPFADIPGFPA